MPGEHVSAALFLLLYAVNTVIRFLDELSVMLLLRGTPSLKNWMQLEMETPTK